MDTNIYKEVYFDQWCDKCKHANLSESEDPCWDCLDEPVNEYSHRPVRFKEKNDE